MTTEKHQCSKLVHDGTRYGSFFPGHCQMKAVIEVDGKWYCKRHSPEGKAKHEAQWQAKIDKQMADDRSKYARIDAINKATSGLSIEELQRVTPEQIRELPELIKALEAITSSIEASIDLQGVHFHENYLRGMKEVLLKASSK